MLLLASAPSTSILHSSPAVPRGRAEALRFPRESVRGRVDGMQIGVSTSLPTDVADESVIAPPPASFDAPAAPTAAPPAVLQSAALSGARSDGVWAVIIGIDDYPGTGSDLRASVNDANDVDAALAAYGVPGDHRLVLRNTQASAATIADAARWLVARASSSATAVFFYAGHVRKVSRGTEAIVAADGRLVTDAALAQLLRPLAARQTWIALAACYAGGFDEVLAPGRILTGAAGPNSLAYENSSFGRSYLVEYMVHRAMLEAKAPASVEQSFAWAADALQRDYPNRVPVEYDELNGDLQLGVAPTAAPAPAPPPPPPGSGGSGGSPSQPAPPPDDPPDDGACVVTVGPLVGCGGS